MGSRTHGPLTFRRLLPSYKADPTVMGKPENVADSAESLRHGQGSAEAGTASDSTNNAGFLAWEEATAPQKVEVPHGPHNEPESVTLDRLPWLPMEEPRQLKSITAKGREGHAIRLSVVTGLRSRADMVPMNVGQQIIKRIKTDDRYFLCNLCRCVVREEEKYDQGRVNGDRCNACHLLKFSKDSFMDESAVNIRNVRTSDGKYYYSYDDYEWKEATYASGGLDEQIAHSKGDAKIRVRTSIPLLYEYAKMIQRKAELLKIPPWDCRLCFHCQQGHSISGGDIEKDDCLCKTCRRKATEAVKEMLKPASEVPLPPASVRSSVRSSDEAQGNRKSPRGKRRASVEAKQNLAASVAANQIQSKAKSPSRESPPKVSRRSNSSGQKSPATTPAKSQPRTVETKDVALAADEDTGSVSSDEGSLSGISEVEAFTFSQVEDNLHQAYKAMARAVDAGAADNLEEDVRKKLVESCKKCVSSVWNHAENQEQVHAQFFYTTLKFNEKNLRRSGRKAKRSHFHKTVDTLASVLGANYSLDFIRGVAFGMSKQTVCGKECIEELLGSHIVEHSISSNAVVSLGLIAGLTICLSFVDPHFEAPAKRLHDYLESFTKLGQIEDEADMLELNRVAQISVAEIDHIRRIAQLNF